MGMEVCGMDSNKPNLTMEPIIELIWSPEEEELEVRSPMSGTCLEGSCSGCMGTMDDINEIVLRDLKFSYSAYVKGNSLTNKNNIDESRNSGSVQVGSENGSIVKKTIYNFNVSFTKGNIYAVVGVNGAGKSTLINLIIGMYIDEYDGIISYDNTDIRSIDMISARKNLIGVAEQEPLLISDTIRYNLDFGNDINLADCERIKNKFAEDAISFLKILNMQDFFSERGLDYVVNENNTNLSGGEKQKISIAKILFKNPTVMIFDEPSSAMDEGAIVQFMNYLHETKQNKIIIIITHDEAVKECCDVVVKISK